MGQFCVRGGRMVSLGWSVFRGWVFLAGSACGVSKVDGGQFLLLNAKCFWWLAVAGG